MAPRSSTLPSLFLLAGRDVSVIYLDYNRTTPLAPSVHEAMQPYWMTHFMLPTQEHSHAQAVGEALENAREGLAAMAGCQPFETVFTSGGTESNNLAILGITQESVPGHLLIGSLEHDSVQRTAQQLRSRGWDVESVPSGPNGVIAPDAVESRLRDNTRLACFQLANPILGTIQPIREIADLCHNRGVHLHCDATQAFGKIPVDVAQLRADTASISGHKFYAPKGSGAIYVRRGLNLPAIMHGEPREMGVRPGAENVPGCVGLGAAAGLAARCTSDASATLYELREHFINGLKSTLDPSPIILCEDALRLPNTVAVEMPAGAKQIQRSARQLVFGTARSESPPDEMTRALRAIGRTDSQIGRTLHFSLGWTTSREQIERAIELLADACDGVLAG